MEYASKSVGNAALTTGIIGTGLGALNALGGGVGSLLGANRTVVNGGCGCNNCGDSVVTRYEATMLQELAAKDGRIALLEADKYTDQKLLDLTNQVYSDFRLIGERINAVEAKAAEESKQNAVYAATVNGTVSCMQQAIAQLQSLTKLVVPNSSVCPGWGNVTITPATSTTTPAA